MLKIVYEKLSINIEAIKLPNGKLIVNTNYYSDKKEESASSN